MANGAIKRKKDAIKAARLRKPEFWNNLFDGMTDRGLSVSEYAKATNSGYGAIMYRIDKDPELRSRFDQALKAKAFGKVEEIERVTEDILKGYVDANSGRVVTDANKWLASRLDNARWGDKQRHDVNVVDKSAMHLEAMRALTSPSVIEGEVVDEGDD
jgi:hypothetical protein